MNILPQTMIASSTHRQRRPVTLFQGWHTAPTYMCMTEYMLAFECECECRHRMRAVQCTQSMQARCRSSLHYIYLSCQCVLLTCGSSSAYIAA